MGLFHRKPVDPEVKAAYEQAYRKRRVELATERGKAKAEEKPFYQKLGGAAQGMFKNMGGKPKGDPFGFFLGRKAAPKRKRKRSKRRRKR
jgi:hypothetical protein